MRPVLDHASCDPPPESGPAPATCLPGCAWRVISLLGSILGAALRHRGRPPISIDRVLPHSPWAVPDGRPLGEDGRRSLGALLRNTREQCTNLSLPVPPVSPQRADRGQFPAFAHRVTVLGSTRNIVATSAGVNSGSASGVRADICVASPPGPVLRSCVFVLPDAPRGASRGCPDMARLRDHTAITSGDASTTRCKVSVPGCPVYSIDHCHSG